jgi:hypothetical protein
MKKEKRNKKTVIKITFLKLSKLKDLSPLELISILTFRELGVLNTIFFSVNLHEILGTLVLKELTPIEFVVRFEAISCPCQYFL